MFVRRGPSPRRVTIDGVAWGYRSLARRLESALFGAAHYRSGGTLILSGRSDMWVSTAGVPYVRTLASTPSHQSGDTG